MCLSCRDHFDGDLRTSIITLHNGGANLIDVNCWEVCAHVVAFDGSGVLVNFVRHLLRSWPTILAVVLDAKILLGSTGVVTCSEDECSVGLLPDWAAFADNCGDGRGGKEAILTNPETLHPIGYTHLDNSLDRRVVEVTSITTNNKRTLRQDSPRCYNGIKCRLHEVIQVMFPHEYLSFFSKTRCSRFLTINGGSSNSCRLESAKARGVGEV
mmetsp:Transcript_4943/g.6812  ORF Transcript_4943/g.6812 Transcript_4943/m.6812 type:complete len:212 (-) Transcript_4943:1493-2128(-)